MTQQKDRWIDQTLGSMTREQKAGQMMVFGMNGTVVTPDMIELIDRYHIGGIRVSQKARVTTLNTLHSYSKPGDQHTDMTSKSVFPPQGSSKDYAFPGHPPVLTIGEYAEFLNRLRAISYERELGVPVHFTIDQEGNGTDDLLGGARLFPHPMGISGSGDPALAYRIGLATGTQARAAGIDVIQCVLDVNTNPENPEVGPRSFGDNPITVWEYASEYFRGLVDAGIMPTGKHFAGRGESTSDAHWGLPVVDLDFDTLMNVHIAPFRKMMEAGMLPLIMAAHCIYPALGETSLPATLSRTVLTDFLRNKMGYRGVIGTDNMMMGGIIKQYEMSEAIVMALVAGCDIVLCRDESPVRIHILQKVIEAMRENRLPEKEVDEKITRILGLRWDMGLHDRSRGIVDAAGAEAATRMPEIVSTAREAARRSMVLMRDREGLLPLSPDRRVLLIEQLFVTQVACNNSYSRPGLLWEELCRHSRSVSSVEIQDLPDESDRARVRRRLANERFDCILITNYFHYKIAGAISDLVEECMATGQPVIVVANNPYRFSVQENFGAVLTCYNPGSRECMKAVADVLYGALEPTARLPVKV